METTILEFKIQGSLPLPYTVSFKKSGLEIKSTCDCKAGFAKQMCKHRLAILKGDLSSLIRTDLDQLKELATWLKGSAISDLIAQIETFENEKLAIDEKIKRLKKQLKKSLID